MFMKAEDLNNSILQLALQGKLIPQDPTDEPASALLKSIEKEKEQLLKNKKIKRNNKESIIYRENGHYYKKIGKKGEPICVDDEIPFEIPDSWEWIKLGSLISIITGTSYKKGDITSKGIRILRGGNIQDTKILLFDDDVFLPNSYYNELKELKKGDIVIVASTGSKKVIGKPGFVKDNYTNVSIGAFLRICRPHMNYLSDYIQFIFASEYYRRHIRKLSQGTNINNVKKEYIEELYIPLPPLKEQKRIIAKFNKILQFIDEYGGAEEQLSKLNSELPKKLKDSILQEAVQGKLVHQDPNDEPASVLLAKIKQEKEQLIKAKKIKRNNKESVIYKEDGHYYEKIGKKGEPVCIDDEIPDKWVWIRFKDICNYGNFLSIDSEEISDDEWVLDLKDIEKDTGKLINFTTKKDVKSKSKKFVFENGDVLYSKLRPYLNKVIIAKKKGYCTTEILPLKFYSLVFNYYAQIVLMSPYFVNYAVKSSYGTKMPRLGTSDGKNAFFPLPPLNEQKRIVDKVKQLFDNVNVLIDG